MRTSPYEEPCGCHWGNADQIIEVERAGSDTPHPDFAFDHKLRGFTMCFRCGAVWTTRDDNRWVRAAEAYARVGGKDGAA